MEKMTVRNDEFFGNVAEMLRSGRQVTIPVKGASMLPAIRGERDLVVLERAPEYRVGDIVLFRYNGRYILHRIIGKGAQADRLLIQGDGVLDRTESLAADAVLARVTRILRGGSRAVDPASPPALRRWRRWRRTPRLFRLLLLALLRRCG